MDQKKVGKFIANCRKEKGLTQLQLAEKLGVTYKTISRWENANYMPDLSLLQQLSNILGVSINELLSGEKIRKEEYQEKLEENIIEVVNYSNQKMQSFRTFLAILFMIFSIFILMVSLIAFPQENSELGKITSICSIGMISCSIAMFLDDGKKHVVRDIVVILVSFLILMALMYFIRIVINKN